MDVIKALMLTICTVLGVDPLFRVFGVLQPSLTDNGLVALRRQVDLTRSRLRRSN